MESPYSINITPGRPPQITVRGENFTDWHSNLCEFTNSPDTAEAVANFVEVAHAAFAAASLTTPTASAPASNPIVKAASSVAVPDMFTFEDMRGAKCTFQHPDAPDLPDGRPYKYVLKEGTNSSGKEYVGLFDPAEVQPQPPEFNFQKGTGQQIKAIFGKGHPLTDRKR